MTLSAVRCRGRGWQVSHRIIELLKLEKTYKILISNCHSSTPMPAKSCPEVPHLHVF